MGVRTRSATPGTLLCLAATALLAVVSFNTPLLKSLYFLEARLSGGQYSGTLRLGTLGYCLNDVCQGPQVGYEFSECSDLDLGVGVVHLGLCPCAWSRPCCPIFGNCELGQP